MFRMVAQWGHIRAVFIQIQVVLWALFCAKAIFITNILTCEILAYGPTPMSLSSAILALPLPVREVAGSAPGNGLDLCAMDNLEASAHRMNINLAACKQCRCCTIFCQRNVRTPAWASKQSTSSVHGSLHDYIHFNRDPALYLAYANPDCHISECDNRIVKSRF
ncbi:hypothetical protein MUK42_17990 [Musa troglodytarum]|uniref:Uncharacterized protein n=1 Tax=Musa troglodytarum TaxID=320322 RepID=A0A9E7JDR4_9LILI|nr:hypothetical protein MUK42_17990 [Musa troglodytarum]